MDKPEKAKYANARLNRCGRSVPGGFPDVLRLESAGKCNFNCLHCVTGNQPNNRALLGKKDFSAIIAQCAGRNFIPRVVVLYHGGEPLLNKNLAYFIRAFKRIGVAKTVISSNGSLLSPGRCRELIMSGLDEIRVSFDGESPEENDAIRKNSDFFRNAANVKALLRLRRKAKRDTPKVIIDNIRVCDINTINAFKPGDRGRQFIFPQPPAYLMSYFKEERHEMGFRSYPAKIWPGYEKSAGFREKNVLAEKARYCVSLFETFTILSNGDVVPCCNDLKGELVLGNVFKLNMFDIWMNRQYSELRRDFKMRRYRPLCAKCEVVSPRFLCKNNRSSQSLRGNQPKQLGK